MQDKIVLHAGPGKAPPLPMQDTLHEIKKKLSLTEQQSSASTANDATHVERTTLNAHVVYSSGIMQASRACDPGSTPGVRTSQLEP